VRRELLAKKRIHFFAETRGRNRVRARLRTHEQGATDYTDKNTD